MTAQGNNIGADLNHVVTRIERLTKDKEEIGDDIREVMSEARQKGLDPKMIREILKIRKLSEDERAEAEHLRDVYLRAMGLLDLVKD